ncbi:MAG TPA: hypothetical protein IGS37_00180 [Synechococcales cyanobacterium M55_K2018_004]|nr:hypothetical protein [Synechococcales cyanobacterium M55_K2018_004]
MGWMQNLLRSLLLTSIFAFLAPVLLIGSILLTLMGLTYVPGLDTMAQAGILQAMQFLQVFGSGSALRGSLVIGVVCSLVGVLFDSFTFYRGQNLRDMRNSDG